MTTEEVIALFGPPSSRAPGNDGSSRLRYLAPLRYMTVEREGYIGFEVHLIDGKVFNWRTVQGNPSYAPFHAPPEMKWTLLLLLAFGAGTAFYAVIRGTKAEVREHWLLLDAYVAREISTRRLPADFRFITHATTLQDVIAKVGPFSHIRKLPLDPLANRREAVGHDVSGISIAAVEYDLPYHAAVVVMPEYPCEEQNTIRAVFVRPPRADEEL